MARQPDQTATRRWNLMTTSRAEGFSDDVLAIAAALPVWACSIRKVTAARHAASATRGLRSRLRGQLRH